MPSSLRQTIGPVQYSKSGQHSKLHPASRRGAPSRQREARIQTAVSRTSHIATSAGPMPVLRRRSRSLPRDLGYAGGGSRTVQRRHVRLARCSRNIFAAWHVWHFRAPLNSLLVMKRNRHRRAFTVAGATSRSVGQAPSLAACFRCGRFSRSGDGEGATRPGQPRPERRPAGAGSAPSSPGSSVQRL
jgi:hypothetical protein